MAGIVAYQRGELAAARERAEEALGLFRQEHDRWFTAQALNLLGDVARGQNDLDRAARLYRESLALFEAQAKRTSTASLLQNLGHVALDQGQPAQALRLLQDAAAVFRDQGDRRGIAECLAGLGRVATARSDFRQACQLFGAAQALLNALGSTLWPSNQDAHQRAVALARDHLPEADFAAAWVDGHSARLEEILDLAFSLAIADDTRPTASSPQPGPTNSTPHLTRREREVAALVANGLTNRQIAAALVISEGTATVHVKRILAKLDFSSRAQIAAWAVTHGLRADSG